MKTDIIQDKVIPTMTEEIQQMIKEAILTIDELVLEEQIHPIEKTEQKSLLKSKKKHEENTNLNARA